MCFRDLTYLRIVDIRKASHRPGLVWRVVPYLRSFTQLRHLHLEHCRLPKTLVARLEKDRRQRKPLETFAVVLDDVSGSGKGTYDELTMELLKRFLGGSLASTPGLSREALLGLGYRLVETRSLSPVPTVRLAWSAAREDPHHAHN